MKNRVKCLYCPVFLSALILTGCVANPDYDIDDFDNIDTDIKVLSNGLELPLGQTDVITLEDALGIIDEEGIDTLLVLDANGNYSISKGGEYDLNDVIADLDIDKLRDIDGVSFQKNIKYAIGEFDQSQFRIKGKQFSYTSEKISDLSLDDIPVPEVSCPEQVIRTELYKYLPEEMDLGKKIGTFEHSENLLDISLLQIPGSVPGTMEVSVNDILQALGKVSIPVEYKHELNSSISLGVDGSKVAGIDNFRLKDGGSLKVDLELQNVPLTDGSITPDLKLDISSLLDLSGTDPVSHKLDLKGLEMNKSNSWKASKTCSINALSSGFPEYKEGKISLKGSVNVDGDVVINNAKSTPDKVNSLSGKNMSLNVRVSFNGVVLDEMDIALGNGISYSVDDIVIPLDINDYTMPKGVGAVKKVYFNQNAKLDISISSSSLKNLKSVDGNSRISVKPVVELYFPSEVEIAEAVNGKVVIEGDLYEGNIEKKLTLVSITPENDGKKLSFNGDLVAKVAAGVSGKVNAKYLPTAAANDIVITARISGQPALLDYDLSIDENEIAQTVSEDNEFSFEIEGMSDFGTFNIKPANSPKATVEFDLPESDETSILADNLVISIPDIIVVGGGVNGFDYSKNTLTLNGALPERIELPISSLKVTPQPGEGDKTVVKGNLKITGKLGVSNTEITRKTVDAISNRTLGVKASIPDITAESIEMEGDFNKNLDYDCDRITILDRTAMAKIPEEVKSLDDVSLDGVKALIELKVTGLPDMNGSTFILKDTRIELPEFLYGENGDNFLVLDRNIEISEGRTILQTAVLKGLKDIQISGKDEISGNVKLYSSLFSSKPSVDVSTLKCDIDVVVRIGVGNGSSVDDPGKLAISKALAKVGYDMEEKQTLSFGDIPEELQDGSVNLSLNPELRLELKTNFGAPCKGSLILTPYVAGQARDAVTVNGIELPYAEDWKNSAVRKYAIGAHVSAAQDETLIASDLSKLLGQIPDSIVVAIKVNIDENRNCVIYPQADYICEMSYNLKVPMSFGSDFVVEQHSDIEIDEDVNDYISIVDDIFLKGSYRTTLPLEVRVEALLLGPDDSPIALNRPAVFSLLSSADGVTVRDGDFELGISIKDPENVDLRKIRINYSVKSSPDVSLNKEQFLQLTGLKLLIPEGVNVDLSE